MNAVAEAVKFFPQLNVNLEQSHNFELDMLCNTVLYHKTPFLLLEATKDINSLKAVQELAQQDNLSLISFNLINYYQQNSNIITIKSPLIFLIESVSLLIEYRNLSNVFIFYDSTYGKLSVEQNKRLAKPSPLSMSQCD